MSDTEPGESSDELKSEWRQLVRHPVTTDSTARSSNISADRAAELAQEQAVYRKRYRKRRTSPDSDAADKAATTSET